MKKHYLILLFLLTIYSYGQNTVGVISNTANSYNGYTLFSEGTETYLIDNCGQVVNQWSSSFKSGKSVYLLENGNLLRAALIADASIRIPGIGGRIELFDWDGNLIWEFDYFQTADFTQHHDIFPMPNGNVVILVAKILTEAEALQLGRDPSLLSENELYNEQILEIEPVGTNAGNIVWEWNIKDHLIQSFDNTKPNFGNPKDNINRLNINFIGASLTKANWLHVNSIQYNATLDQIILSTRMLSEFYIIDHSTTTAEAATSSGGTYGKGGDFLYRWGNPEAYSLGTSSDRKLFGQHFPHWIPAGYPDAGKIMLFNNGFERSSSFSEVLIITPPSDSPGFYTAPNPNTAFGPLNAEYSYTKPTPTDFFSNILSSAQRLPNGNTLICEGTSGRFFEIDSSNNIVWEYINPIHVSGVMTQGDNADSFNNNTFRAFRYGPNYAAFSGRNLTPGLPIELNPNLNACTVLGVEDLILNEIKIFPNPVSNVLSIQSTENIKLIEIFNPLGKLIKRIENKKAVDVSNLSSGFYIVKIYALDKVITKKVVKI